MDISKFDKNIDNFTIKKRGKKYHVAIQSTCSGAKGSNLEETITRCLEIHRKRISNQSCIK